MNTKFRRLKKRQNNSTKKYKAGASTEKPVDTAATAPTIDNPTVDNAATAPPVDNPTVDTAATAPPVDNPTVDTTTEPNNHDIDTYFFPNENNEGNIYISVQFIPSTYQSLGIIHLTESTAINIARGLFTSVANVFGKAGFDNTIFDKLRNSALKKIKEIVKQKNSDLRVYNLRMDFETNAEGTIFLHAYGDLCEKKTA